MNFHFIQVSTLSSHTAAGKQQGNGTNFYFSCQGVQCWEMGVLFGISYFILFQFSLFDLNFLFLSRLIWCSNFMGYVIFCGTNL